ncbi:hypothetical protein QSV08_07555 [Maribacter sp. BPC-D8]|uniref:hypothetical protein n=1 Tax=Maribacter sp. BPC-D8 TaxID=3053613 RepID=UPI002B483B2D|nr:hypothetical protein [Maribacter sp. BPC-D8]WRI31099.1 hypothetical protein QSV08_07555 [Maribacter sp. BPC-D8]
MVNETIEENIQSLKEIEKSEWNELRADSYKTFKNDTYRLTIYPTWTNAEISEYKMENGWGDPKISIKRYERILDGQKTHLKKIGETEEIPLSENDWNQFDNLVTEQCFWTMPIRSKSQYLDGTGWILEVKKGKTNSCSDREYHIVSRVTDSPKYFEICDRLLKLGNSSQKEQDSLLYKSWTSD